MRTINPMNRSDSNLTSASDAFAAIAAIGSASPYGPSGRCPGPMTAEEASAAFAADEARLVEAALAAAANIDHDGLREAIIASLRAGELDDCWRARILWQFGYNCHVELVASQTGRDDGKTYDAVVVVDDHATNPHAAQHMYELLTGQRPYVYFGEGWNGCGDFYTLPGRAGVARKAVALDRRKTERAAGSLALSGTGLIPLPCGGVTSTAKAIAR